jgi:alpha(1,3/1,4) fucosyltransferase
VAVTETAAAPRCASIVVQRERANRIFQPGAGPNGGDFFLPWRPLRERFAREGIELNTPDVNAGRAVAFEFHLNAQRKLPARTPCYAFLYEDPLVRPLNADRAQLARYRKVFTWNEDLIDDQHFLRLDYPNDLSVRDVPGWRERPLWCVLIASNKALRYPDARALHGRRVEVIRYFEAHAPESFALYGHGWNIPPVQPGALGRLAKRLHEWRARWQPDARPFPSYRGKVGRKSDVLERARFCICYENSRGSPGYLTEKIFDCFTSGCVPVYIGTPHAEAAIPPSCFLDGDRFASPAELLACLRSIDETQFAAYQRAMREFLLSPASARFSNAHFCERIVGTIIADQA